MSEVFADAFYYIALLNPADQFHAAAVSATESLTQRVTTTAWVLMEVADALSAPTVRQRTFSFLSAQRSIRTQPSCRRSTLGTRAA